MPRPRPAAPRHLHSLLVLFALGACASPRVLAFSATPRRFCPGASGITLAWEVDGSATLEAEPPFAGAGPVASQGRLVVPAADRRVVLTARKPFSDPQRREQVLTAVRDGEVTTLGPETRDVTCDEARREVVAVVAFEPAEFDGQVAIRSLENGWDRELAVAHRGRAWAVPAGGAVDLQPRPGDRPDPGVLTGGAWVLRARLLDDERCGTPSAARLLHILLNARLGC